MMTGSGNITKDYETRVYTTAQEAGLTPTMARILVAQSKHESGNYTSGLFQDDANAFGMKMPVVRKSPYIDGSSTKHKAPSSEGGDLRYAHFRSLEDSVKDVIHRLKYGNINFSAITSVDSYVAELVRIKYFQATPVSYLAAVKKHYNNTLIFA